MLNQLAIEDALVTWLLNESGLPEAQVLMGDQNVPIPKTGAYVEIKLGTITRKGYDQARPSIDNAGNRSLLGQREWACTISAYRSGTAVILENIATSLQREDVRNLLGDSGIVVFDAGPILDTTVTLEKVRRESHVMEVFLRIASDVQEQVGYIARVALEATTQSPPAPDSVVATLIPPPTP